jgi:hypothetical protein
VVPSSFGPDLARSAADLVIGCSQARVGRAGALAGKRSTKSYRHVQSIEQADFLPSVTFLIFAGDRLDFVGGGANSETISDEISSLGRRDSLVSTEMVFGSEFPGGVSRV